MESWQTLLQSGDAVAAWDEFIARYRRLIFAAIRHSLGAALLKAGRSAEAAAVEQRFTKAWAESDVKLSASRF